MKRLNPQTLTWAVTLCVALTLLTSAYVAYRSMEGEIANQFNKQQEMLVKQAASGIEAHIQEILFTLKLATSLERRGGQPAASAVMSGELPSGNLKTLYDQLNGKVTSIIRVDELGIPKQAYPETILEQIKNRNYRTADYFTSCWTTGQPYVSKWVTDKAQPKKVTVSVPVLSEGESRNPPEFKGILIADVDLDTIIHMYIKPIKSGESGFAWLIDSNGTLLYHPFHPRTGGPEDPADHPADRPYDEDQNNCIGCHQSFELEARMVTGEAGHTRLRVDPGQEYLVAYSPVHIDGAIWAAIGVNVPYSEVTHSVRKSLICIFILVIVTIAIISGGAAVIIRTNNKRIRAEEKLRWSEQLLESKKRLQALFDGITDGIAIIDRNFRIKDLNKAFAALSQVVVNQVIEELCYKQLSCKEKHCAKCPLHLAFETGKPAFVEDSVLDADGSTKDFELYAYPLKNEKGEVIQAVFYIKDVTKRKELQQRVLESERLVTIGKMAAQVAHEIRNPLSSISLNAELLEDEIHSYEGVPTEEAKSLLTTIMTEVDRLAAITEDYLKFARLPKPILQEENVTHLLLDLLRFSKEEISERRIQVTTQFDASVPEIKADEKQLREAFLNILKNAFEAMPQGGELRITTAKVGDYVEVAISDTGVGIEERNLERVFNPFFTTKETGTGLGLSLTQQIIREHGGTIHCKSQLGVGTTFTIRFPISGD